MKVFITGGGGFLGTCIVKKLRERNYQVTSYSRSHYPHLEEIGVQSIQGDMNDYEALKKAIKGHDVCFHVASKIAMWGKYQDFYQTNVLGTEYILKACQEVGINKFIYTSSPSVVFGDHGLSGEDETLPYPTKSFSLYGQTKALAEQRVMAAANENFYTVSLRPHLVFGPGDQNIIPRVINSAKAGKLKIVGEGDNQVDVIYVDNAADAHLCALDALLENPEIVSGQTFFLGQGPVNLWNFINRILKVYELDPVTDHINAKLAYFIGFMMEMIAKVSRLYRLDPPMTRFVALQFSENHYYDHKKAHQLLKWEPKIDLNEALGRLR